MLPALPVIAADMATNIKESPLFLIVPPHIIIAIRWPER